MSNTTITVKMDWSDETIAAVIAVLRRHDNDPEYGRQVREAIADIELYRAAMETVQLPDDKSVRDQADAAFLRYACTVLERHEWPGTAALRQLADELHTPPKHPE